MELESNAQSYRTLYDDFLLRYTESVQQQSFPMTQARVVTPAARPLTKSQPKTLLVLLISASGGMIFGLMIGHLRDLADRVFRTRDQVERLLALDCLATVPKIKVRKPKDVPSPAPKHIKVVRAAQDVNERLNYRPLQPSWSTSERAIRPPPRTSLRRRVSAGAQFVLRVRRHGRQTERDRRPTRTSDPASRRSIHGPPWKSTSAGRMILRRPTPTSSSACQRTIRLPVQTSRSATRGRSRCRTQTSRSARPKDDLSPDARHHRSASRKAIRSRSRGRSTHVGSKDHRAAKTSCCGRWWIFRCRRMPKQFARSRWLQISPEREYRRRSAGLKRSLELPRAHPVKVSPQSQLRLRS